jgi:hypothetical protein
MKKTRDKRSENEISREVKRPAKAYVLENTDGEGGTRHRRVGPRKIGEFNIIFPSFEKENDKLFQRVRHTITVL